MVRWRADDPHWGWHAAQSLGADVAPKKSSAPRRNSGRGAAWDQQVRDQSSKAHTGSLNWLLIPDP
jgi:hypothetical protein